MADNPYKIEPPALISFSGGRTSAFMLRQILDAHGGTLPDGVHVTFANTGKERPETLDFVRECGERWNVPIVLMEYRNVFYPHRDTDEKVSEYAARVTYDNLSREGEPFAAVIRSRAYLPNPVARYCTKELKLRVLRDWMLYCGIEKWANVTGIRADEPKRAVRPSSTRGEATFPFYEAGVTESDVMEFWANQPFDLRLKQYEGNCNLCFLKSRQKLLWIMRDDPRQADWWIAQEEEMRSRGGMSRWREDRPRYAEMREDARGGPLYSLPVIDDEIADCNCTD